MRRRNKILVVTVAILLLIQLPFFRPAKNYSEVKPVDDIGEHYEISMDVQMHLINACYDCHSNYTQEYPWYYNIQPVSWWIDGHIQKAKEEVNFSEFGAYPVKKALRKFEEIEEVMETREMPLKSYLWMHPEAVLKDKENKDVIEWAQKMQKDIREKSGV